MASLALVASTCGKSHEPPASHDDTSDVVGSTRNPGGHLGRTAQDGNSTYLNVLPPGSNGNSAGGIGIPVDDLQFVYPAHFRDALDLYGDLAFAASPLQAEPCTPPGQANEHQKVSNLTCNYFKHEGLTPDTTNSEVRLTAPSGKTVTIRRDGWGVPFVDAEDRGAAMFGVGYAGAEDRLWLYDVLRHLGRGRFSEYLGPAADTYSFDANFASVAGYDESELTRMIEGSRSKFGSLGDLVVSDLDNLVAGLNAYVDFLRTPAGLGHAPPEYVSLALQPGGDLIKFPPPPFRREDVVASAILIQSLFATGGGKEHIAALLLERLDPSFGPSSTSVPKDACEFWRDVRHALDPQTPRTIAEAFPTQSPAAVDETCPQQLPPGVAIWDPGSFRMRDTFAPQNSRVALPPPPPGSVPNTPLWKNLLPSLLPVLGLIPNPFAFLPAPWQRPSSGGEPLPPPSIIASLDPIAGAHAALDRAGIPLPRRLSNFIAVTGEQTRSGHPIAVMGPQTAYFLPQLLWEVAVLSHGGTDLDFAGRGVVFANLPYINIGRGLDYAFSATSGESDQIDVRVSRLCNLDGSAASREDANGDGFPDADGYLVDVGDNQGMTCRALYKRLDEWVAQPTVASVALGGPPAPETIRRYILRTHYGPVLATATVNGVPVVISDQRTTFLGELDTSIPFALATTPQVKSARDFQKIFNSLTGTFNWIYLDKDDVGYLHSGLFPKRASGVHPELPSWGDGRYEWPVDKAALNAAFFSDFGGSRPFPNRARPVPGGDSTTGYFEWPGYLSLAEHPQVINPPKGTLASWNNAPANGWWAADFNGSYGPTHRAAMLEARLDAYKAIGKKHDLASMVEIMADAAFTDLRGQEVLPLLLSLMRTTPLTAEQDQVASFMQGWIDAGSRAWISGGLGLGAFRRDRDDSGSYDMRAQVLLMDAWYPRLIEQVLPQLLAHDGFVGQDRYDAPAPRGSAFQEGWFEPMKRVLEMALGSSSAPYRQLRCADGTMAGCRAAVLAALDQALVDLGGFDHRQDWTSSAGSPAGGMPVEAFEAIQHVSFSLLKVPAIHWTNRPTFQQAVEIQTQRLP